MDGGALPANAIAENFFREFLSFELPLGSYMSRIERMASEGRRRLVVNVDDLRAFDAAAARAFVASPNAYLPYWERVLEQQLREARTRLNNNNNNDINNNNNNNNNDKTAVRGRASLAFDGALGAHHVTPRALCAPLLTRLVMVEGLVTKATLVKPKLVSSVQYNATRNALLQRSYRDATSAAGPPTSSTIMSRDPTSGDVLSLEFGLCAFMDHQSCTLQELPERAPAGQLPRSVHVLLDDDLADSVKPGDRVAVVGVYRALPSAHDGRAKGAFKTAVVACHVRPLTMNGALSIEGTHLTATDIQNINAVAAGGGVFERLSRSVAPSIYGHDHVKKALLLLLLGGVEHNLASGAHLRGDINVMLIGDPSTAKSQLLRFVLNIAPLAVSTSGRGSSGVGLTAAVTTDPETKERRLEAGAMVLADRGVVCIDEFDKMSEDDRVAIHEVMEQGSCTINKAGIHTSLNARCSVLAAANPVYGQYNRQKKPSENIALPDSLLSRFDLMFIVLDNLDPKHDRAISHHVLKMHMYRRPGTQQGIDPFQEAENEADDLDVIGSSLVSGGEVDAQGTQLRDTPVYQKFSGGARDGEEVFTTAFLKKYIMYARARIVPVLSEEAAQFVSSKYAELRSKEDTKTLPVTPRTFETLIRLSTAHAKCRLSRTVELEDAMAAADIMKFALYNEVEQQAQQQQQQQEGQQQGQQQQQQQQDGNENIPRTDDGNGVDENSPGQKRRRADEGLDELGDKQARLEASNWIVEAANDRRTRGRKLFKTVMAERRAEHCVMPELVRWMNQHQAAQGAKYREWNDEELWELLGEWAAQDDPDGVMIERGIGQGEIFNL